MSRKNGIVRNGRENGKKKKEDNEREKDNFNVKGSKIGKKNSGGSGKENKSENRSGKNGNG